jgi:ADP-ribose pyrophosphatase
MTSTPASDETVFEGRIFHVIRRAALINGRTHHFDIVQHPGAAVILPILDDQRVVLIHNYRVSIEIELLEVPAGTIDPGEAPIDCARRELAEETGYHATHIQPLVTCYSSPGILNERMESFLATGLSPGTPSPESGEQIRLAPMTLPAALDAIAAGRIVDGKTILTLLYYDRFIRDQDNA